MGDDLQRGGEQRPQRGPGDADDPQAKQPEEADGERVLHLRDGPMLESGGCDADVVGGRHFDAANFRANSTGNDGVAPAWLHT